MRVKYLGRASAVTAGVLAALVTAACGGGNEAATDGGGSGSGSGTDQSPLTAYVSCMKENGVELTLPTGGPDGVRPSGGARPSGAPPSGAPGGGGFRGGLNKPDNVDQETWDKAREACASSLPSMGPGRGPGSGQQGGGQPGGGSAAAYRNCLSDRGVTDVDNPDATDDTVAAALDACKVLSPAPSPSA